MGWRTAPPLSPPPGKPSKKLRNGVLIAVGAVVAFGIFGSLLQEPEKAEPAAPSQSTNPVKTYTASPRPSVLETSTAAAPSSEAPPPTVEKPAGPDGVNFHTEPGPTGDVVFADFEIGDGFTKGMIADGAQRETVEILKYARDVYPSAARVLCRAAFQ